MLRSMTGYGLGKSKIKEGMLTAELRSLNYRYLEVVVRLPEELKNHEKKAKDLVKARAKRGRINLHVNFERSQKYQPSFTINKKAAAAYLKALRKLKKDYNLKGEVSLEHLVNAPEIFKVEPVDTHISHLWPKVKIAINRALNQLEKSRLEEGRFMDDDLRKRTREIERLLSRIKKRVPVVLRSYKKSLLKRSGQKVNAKIKDERMRQDFAAFAQGCDISEEVTRIQAHVKHFNKTLRSKKEAGKKLDFIAQELSREANTIAAKTQDYQISDNVIEIKAEIEKIREQVQNVE